jgi:two-component system chemotaxis response regulator CheB
VAQSAGQNAIGVILTGMGDDGAAGMLEMKERGSYNIAQDEASCIVFGMPNQAIKRGGVHKVLPLNAIAPMLMKLSLGGGWQNGGSAFQEARVQRDATLLPVGQKD